MTTRKERVCVVRDDIQEEWCEMLVSSRIHPKNSMLTPEIVRKHPQILNDDNGVVDGYRYSANENATAEIIYEFATKQAHLRTVQEFFDPYFRCSKRFMDDYLAGWKWDHVPVDWRKVCCNVHLTREFVEKYVPHEYLTFALSVHYTVSELETFYAIDGLFTDWHIFNSRVFKYNRNITSEYIMKHRYMHGIFNYINFYKKEGLDHLNMIDYPLVCWNDFTIEYFDGLCATLSWNHIKFQDVVAHPAITCEHFMTILERNNRLFDENWLWMTFAKNNPNCTLKFLNDHTKPNSVYWYNNSQHEKKEFVERKMREHMAAYKIQQWWLFVSSSPEYAVGRRGIEAGYDAEFCGGGEKM